jgi:hypothetical protein
MTNADDRDFWLRYPPDEAFEIPNRLLGEAAVYRGAGFLKGRPYYRVGYPEDFEFSRVEPHLRKELDEIEWRFLTIKERKEYNGQKLLIFGMAPILPKKLDVAYHATRACLIPKICGENGEGLLPSNAERRATAFPDTEGVIHVCAKLTHEGNENDSAEWWKKELSEKNIFGDQNWGIVRIDMTHLPATARVYQDMHSASGVIVDRIDRIPGRLIEPVTAK